MALREVAHWLDAHPECPPSQGLSIQISTHTKEDAVALVRALGKVQKSESGPYLKIARNFGPVQVWGMVQRAEVCTSRVVGTETVEIADPLAPKVTITRDVVEWDCSPLLAGEL
jgi:hypothetical protein